MKFKHTVLLAFCILLSISVFSQAPSSFKYQSMVRKTDGLVLANQLVKLKISILKGSTSGTSVYSEVHSTTSNAFGIINVNIGEGSEKTSSISNIDWSIDTYFVKIEMDENGGTNNTLSAISQLLSVPYALHANTAGSIDWSKIQNKPSLFSGSYNDLSDKPVTNGSETKVSAGSNISITGTGTSESPYVINSIVNMSVVQRDALTPIEGLIVYNTTTHKPNFYNGVQWMNFDGTSAKTLAIGDTCQGGIIAYILQPGDPGYIAGETHGLIAAPNDQSTGMQWYNGSSTTTGATGSAIGTGNANTITIVSNQGTGSYAAQLCADLVLNGYSDWYLPSKDELNKLYLNKVAIGGFTLTGWCYYWSSTEIDNGTAYAQFFTHGGLGFNGKYGVDHVRAVRSF